MSNPDMTWIPSGDGEKRKVHVLTSDGTRYDYQSALDGVPSPSQVRWACRVRAILLEYQIKEWTRGEPGAS